MEVSRSATSSVSQSVSGKGKADRVEHATGGWPSDGGFCIISIMNSMESCSVAARAAERKNDVE